MAVTLSILISCILWFTFTMQENYVHVIQMPTEVRNLPQDQALSELPPRNVRVEVEGPGWQLFGLFGLGSDAPVIPIDASQPEVNVQAAVQSIANARNVTIRGVVPAAINIQTEQRIMQRIPVQENAVVDTPPEYDFTEPLTVSPDSVRVMGARSVVAGLQFWPTEPYRNLDVRDSLRVFVPLVDTLEGLVIKEPDAVMLRAEAEVFTQGTREIDVTTPGMPSTEQVVKLEPSTIRVRYRVPLSQYDAVLQAPDFFAQVAYEDILRDTTGRITPNLNLPEGLDIRDVEMSPPTLRYFQVVGQ